jgi:hypothetical protein
MEHEMQKVLNAYLAVQQAKENLHQTVLEVLIPGKTIHWDQGGHPQVGVILSGGTYGESVLVKNFKTEKMYWIGIYQILVAHFEMSKN